MNRRLLHLIIATLTICNKIYSSDYREGAVIPLKTKAAELRSLYKFKEAIPMLQQIVKIYDSQSEKNTEELATALINLGINYEDAGLHEKATPFLKRAVDLRKGLFGLDSYPFIRALNNLACNHVYLGDYESAIPLLKKCMEFKQHFLKPDNEDLVRATSNLANAYHNAGHFNDAFYYYEKSLELCNNLGENKNLVSAVSITNLGHLYYDLGDYFKSVQLFTQALQIRLENIGYYNKLTAQSYENIGCASQALGNFKAAMEAYGHSLEIYSTVFSDDHSNIGNIYNSLGTLCLEVAGLNDDKAIYEEAISLFNKSLSNMKKYFSENYIRASLPYYNIAIAYLEKDNDYRTALFYADKSFAITKNRLGEHHKDNLKNLMLLAKLYYLMEDESNYRYYAQKAIICYNENFQNILVLDEKSRDFYNNYNHSLFELIPCLDSNAIASLLLNRKGLINESFASVNKLLSSSGADKSLKTDLESLKYLKKILQNCSESTLTQSVYTGLNDKIAELERKIFRHNSKLAPYHRQTQYTTYHVSQKLNRGSILIDFIQFNDIKERNNPSIYLGAVILSDENSPIFVRINDCEAIFKSIKSLHTAISNNGAGSDIETETKFLSEKLWAPIAAKIPNGSNHLFICPDANLNFLSFASLLDKDGKFIIENYSITYLGSARDLIRESHSNFSKSIVIFADPQFDAKLNSHNETSILNIKPSELEIFKNLRLSPLHGSRSEALSLQSIAANHGWITELYLGSNATEGNLGKVYSPGILHIATHCFYLESNSVPKRNDIRGMSILSTSKSKNVFDELKHVNPKRANWLALSGAAQTLNSWSFNKAPAPANDGIFTADEANLLNLNDTWLVVISACDSGLGKSISGEGISGIRNSLAIAGARNVLISTTPVPDDLSSHFMSDFYKNALANNNLSISFSKTQREWLINLKNKGGLSYSIANVGGLLLYSNQNEK